MGGDLSFILESHEHIECRAPRRANDMSLEPDESFQSSKHTCIGIFANHFIKAVVELTILPPGTLIGLFARLREDSIDR